MRLYRFEITGGYIDIGAASKDEARERFNKLRNCIATLTYDKNVFVCFGFTENTMG